MLIGETDSKHPVFERYEVTGKPGHCWINASGRIKNSLNLDSPSEQHRLIQSFARIQDDGLSWINENGLPAFYEADGYYPNNQLKNMADAASALRGLCKLLKATKELNYKQLEKLSVVKEDTKNKNVTLHFLKGSAMYYSESCALIAASTSRMNRGECFSLSQWKKNETEYRHGAALRWLIDATNIMLLGVQYRIELELADKRRFGSVLKPRCPWEAMAIWFERQVSDLPLRNCPICHKSLAGMRPHSETCIESSCRKALYRRKQKLLKTG
jgi:hypothetical protein